MVRFCHIPVKSMQHNKLIACIPSKFLIAAASVQFEQSLCDEDCYVLYGLFRSRLKNLDQTGQLHKLV